jgi:hypothetical protein
VGLTTWFGDVPLVIIPLAANPIKELSTGTQVKDQVEVMSGLKVIDETADVRVASGDSFEDGDLVSDLSDRFRWGSCVRLVYQACFGRDNMV